ncbi:hypothetical protein CHY_2515 [Carboxydothermus hydrogenoformans Z-2901]|uniref:Uncharacterized protein n=1 Tax=Carboxydothermus hydrogenoformans (strain ATCC BAA-161 / DSM 6008 / Z-2901) TaxID=246194 RepID=Q3A976_CARHZ|nr:hypothetical protein CHY_2515 [Carboxydothermus hydrogenoformans Z-2901]
MKQYEVEIFPRSKVIWMDPISFYITKVLFFAIVFVIVFERIKATIEGFTGMVKFLKRICKKKK